MAPSDPSEEKLKTIRWFLSRPWRDGDLTLDINYFAHNFAPDQSYASLQARDAILLKDRRECLDFLDAFKELAKKYYHAEYCWCGPQVVVAIPHAVFARTVLAGDGREAYGLLSSVKWHCFPRARLSEGLAYEDWLSGLDNQIRIREGEFTKPYDLWDSERIAVNHILGIIELKTDLFDGFFCGLTADDYTRCRTLAEAGTVEAIQRLVEYHTSQASFLPGSREKGRNEQMGWDVLCKYAEVGTPDHCVHAAAAHYFGSARPWSKVLTPQGWFGESSEIEDFLTLLPGDLGRALSYLRLALKKHESGLFVDLAHKVPKEEVVLKIEALALALEIAGNSQPARDLPAEVVSLAKAYACRLILPHLVRTKVDKIDELAIAWGCKLGCSSFGMMAAVYAWRGDAISQYAWCNLRFLDGDDHQFPESLYPEERVFPDPLRFSPLELDTAQALTFDILKQMLVDGKSAIPVSSYVRFRLGLSELRQVSEGGYKDDDGIFLHSFECLLGNVWKDKWFGSGGYRDLIGSSPQDYAAALAWLAVLAEVEDEVINCPADAVHLVTDGLNKYAANCRGPTWGAVYHEYKDAYNFLVSSEYAAQATLKAIPEPTISRAVQILRRVKAEGWTTIKSS